MSAAKYSLHYMEHLEATENALDTPLTRYIRNSGVAFSLLPLLDTNLDNVTAHGLDQGSDIPYSTYMYNSKIKAIFYSEEINSLYVLSDATPRLGVHHEPETETARLAGAAWGHWQNRRWNELGNLAT